MARTTKLIKQLIEEQRIQKIMLEHYYKSVLIEKALKRTWKRINKEVNDVNLRKKMSCRPTAEQYLTYMYKGEGGFEKALLRSLNEIDHNRWRLGNPKTEKDFVNIEDPRLSFELKTFSRSPRGSASQGVASDNLKKGIITGTKYKNDDFVIYLMIRRKLTKTYDILDMSLETHRPSDWITSKGGSNSHLDERKDGYRMKIKLEL